MNEEKRNKILGKLRKLMDLKESASQLGNEGEANAAAAGISRLLMEYNLTEEDIPQEQREKNPVVMQDIPASCRGHKGNWYLFLVGEISRNNLCTVLKSVSSQRIGTRIIKEEVLNIVGRRENVDVVIYLTNFLSTQFQSIGRRRYNGLSRYSQDPLLRREVSQSSYMTSFLLGCVSGLRDKYEEMRQQMEQESGSKVTALTLTTRNENLDFINNQFGKVNHIDKVRSANSINANAYRSGVDTGRNANLNSALTNKQQSKNKSITNR